MKRTLVPAVLFTFIVLPIFNSPLRAQSGTEAASSYLRIECQAVEDEVFTFIPTQDPWCKGMEISYLNYPEWLSVLEDSIFGIPPEGVKEASFLVLSKDDGQADTARIVITVQAVNDAPVVTSEPEDLATQGLPYTYIARAEDPDGDRLTYAFTDFPEWLSAGGQVISGTPPAGVTEAMFMVTVTDGKLSNSRYVYLEVQPGETAQDEFNRLITNQLGFVVYPSPIETEENIVYFGFTWKGKSIKYSLNLFDMEGNIVHHIEEEVWNPEKIVRTHTFDSRQHHIETGNYVAELRVLDKEHGTTLKSRKIVFIEGEPSLAKT